VATLLVGVVVLAVGLAWYVRASDRDTRGVRVTMGTSLWGTGVSVGLLLGAMVGAVFGTTFGVIGAMTGGVVGAFVGERLGVSDGQRVDF
jgi:MFS family permease